MVIVLKSYPNESLIKDWIKLGFQRDEISVEDFYDKTRFERVLNIIPQKEGKIEIRVSLNSNKLKRFNQVAEGDQQCIYRLNNQNCSIKINVKREVKT